MRRVDPPALRCTCGLSFRSYAAKTFHRHNFPMLCEALRTKRVHLKLCIDGKEDEVVASITMPCAVMSTGAGQGPVVGFGSVSSAGAITPSGVEDARGGAVAPQRHAARDDQGGR